MAISPDNMPDSPQITPNTATTPAKTSKVKSLVIMVILATLIGFVSWGLWRDQSENAGFNLSPNLKNFSGNKKSQVLSLQGHIEVQQTPIGAKVPGRIAKIHVKEGDSVQIGTPLIDIDSAEINAKIEQAQAGKTLAQSQLNKADNGARPQEVEMAKYQWHAAQSASDLAKVSYERVNRMAEEGLMSRQKRDEAYTNYIASQDKARIAKAQYDMTKVGTRSEDKDAAQAQVAQVDAKIKEAMVAKEEANLKSPIAGVVDSVIIKTGEVVGQGVPMLTLVDPNDQWVVLNVTENNLNYFAVGSSFTATVPALSTADKPYRQQFKVYASSVLSDFATWRPTNSKDGFDMRTFEVKARPVTPDSRMRHGMTVTVDVVADKK